MSWSIVPLLFGLAGAAGVALDALLSGVVMGRYGDTAGICAYIGGGIGLGIGAAMCLSRHAWIGILSSPFLGVAGYFLTLSLYSMILGEKPPPRLKDLLDDRFALLLAAPAAPLLVAAHHLHLRLLKCGLFPVRGDPDLRRPGRSLRVRLLVQGRPFRPRPARRSALRYRPARRDAVRAGSREVADSSSGTSVP